jgi:hypothetical protein
MTPQRPSIDQPEEGLYKLRMVRGGPWLPCKIWFAAKARSEDQTPCWQCLVNGLEADVWETWPRVGGRGITAEEYGRLLPSSSPDRPLNKLKTRPIF